MKKYLGLPVLLGLAAICSSAYAAGPFIPGGVDSAGYTYVVPDMLLWYNVNGYYTNGPIATTTDQVQNFANWEPCISVLGDSVFLVGANTFADDGTFTYQRFVEVFQPVGGGTPKIGDSFYADNGTPFRNQINLSRQDGNPQRVAGDKRLGATTFLTMAEASPGQLTEFQSDNRWTNNPMYLADNRYAVEQVFTLSSGLVQTPVAKAWDYVYGPLVTDVIPEGNGGNQLSRVGGSCAALDNGNFVIVISDKTCFSSTVGEVATMAVITPTGSVVKSATLVDPRNIWDNVCAFRGGFAVRCQSMIYFYDNAGTLKASTNIVDSSGIAFSTDRGDGTRIGSDIRSRFVYLAGAAAIPEVGAAVQMAIWNGTNGAFVTNVVVSSDLDPTVFSASDVNLAVDLSDRVCVAYGGKADNTVFTKDQIIARVLQFNGKLINGPSAITNANVKFVTPSFFPFKCSDTTNNLAAILGFNTWVPSVAMTKDAICIAAKGTVNSQGVPESGPDTMAETTLYTVIAQPYVPGGIESVGLTRIVPDTPVILTDADKLGNWEPYASVLGNSTFLIEANTFALDDYGSVDFSNQREVIAFQPVAGGAMKLGDVFFADNGTPFRLPNNLSRQNGNPGRVVGDKRPGATNFLALAEASLGQLEPFQSDNRWTNNPMFQGSCRYVCGQVFSLSPTLVQTPRTKAWDFVYGPLVTDVIDPNDATQLSRTGGTGACLDNGNWVVAIDDKTGYTSAGKLEVATFVIISPTGAILKTATLVDPHDLWDNVTSYKGGFCVRVHNLLYFYDNDGNLKGTANQTVTGINYDAGRGDGTRIAGHINSPYVYLIGADQTAGVRRMCLSVFDSRDQSFVTEYDVSEPGFQSVNDRANLCVDALNRITASWVTKPDGFAAVQVAARVLRLNESTKTIEPITHSFWVFVNAILVPQVDNLIRTLQMFPAMTTKQICVAAKGEINLQNQPQNGFNSYSEINFYTVFTHPDPQDDPTPAAGARPTMTLTKLSATQLMIEWAGTGYRLVSTGSLPPGYNPKTPWGTTVTSTSPATVTIGAGTLFFRLENP